MYKFIALSIIYVISQSIYAQPLEVSGVLEANTVWEADTIIITDNVLVPDSVNLLIRPGTIVLANTQKHILIKGSLTAIGEPTQSIIFSVINTEGSSDTSTIAGTWGGLRFIDLNAQGDSSILDYCVIEYGGAYAGTPLEVYGGGVFINNSTPIRISNSIIQYNYAQRGGAGICVYENSGAIISNNLIRYNTTRDVGGGIMSWENSYPVIKNNIIVENEAFRFEVIPPFAAYIGRGGGISINTLSEEHYPKVISNIICNNSSSSGGGVYESSFGTTVVSNIICNNKGIGIFTGNSISHSMYVNNTIVNNQGRGIWTLSSNIKITNNIVQNNFEYLWGSDVIIDTIDIAYKSDNLDSNFFYNNVGSVKKFDSPFIEDLQNKGEGNINTKPHFINPTESYGLDFNGYEADWRLVESDADINAGTTTTVGILDILPDKDAYGGDRIQGETIDIGALEFELIDDVQEVPYDAVKIFPNPFSGQFWIELKNPLSSFWTLSVWNESGKIISTYQVNSKITSINTSYWPQGIYFIEGQNGKGQRVFIRKLIKGK